MTLIESPHRRISSYRGHLDRLNQIDFLGTSIFALTVVCLLLALQWGGTVYAWSNARLIVLFALSLILFATFLAIQHRKRERAMLPLRFLQEQTVLMGTIFAFGLASTLAITQYYVSLPSQLSEIAHTAIEILILMPTERNLVPGGVRRHSCRLGRSYAAVSRWHARCQREHRLPDHPSRTV